MGEGITGEVAAVAHRCWCEAMARSGWRPGPYDERARTHDALRPFGSLDPEDRRLALEAIRDLGLVRVLEEAMDYPRGPDRRFAASEMRAGLPVAIVPAPGAPICAAGGDRGVIESWELDADGALRLIRVRWPGGELSEHAPEARELRRV